MFRNRQEVDDEWPDRAPVGLEAHLCASCQQLQCAGRGAIGDDLGRPWRASENAQCTSRAPVEGGKAVICWPVEEWRATARDHPPPRASPRQPEWDLLDPFPRTSQVAWPIRRPNQPANIPGRQVNPALVLADLHLKQDLFGGRGAILHTQHSPTRFSAQKLSRGQVV